MACPGHIMPWYGFMPICPICPIWPCEMERGSMTPRIDRSRKVTSGRVQTFVLGTSYVDTKAVPIQLGTACPGHMPWYGFMAICLIWPMPPCG